MVAKPEWGHKRMCLSCGARFYDLNRNPITCPKCGSEFDPEAFVKLKRGRGAVVEEKAAAPKAAVADDLEGDDLEDDIDTDSDDDVLEDTSDLDDDTDVPGVSTGDDDDE